MAEDISKDVKKLFDKLGRRSTNKNFFYHL